MGECFFLDNPEHLFHHENRSSLGRSIMMDPSLISLRRDARLIWEAALRTSIRAVCCPGTWPGGRTVCISAVSGCGHPGAILRSMSWL